MNRLGQLKSLLDIHMLRGLSSTPKNTLNESKGTFQTLFQEALWNITLSSTTKKNTNHILGSTYQQILWSPKSNVHTIPTTSTSTPINSTNLDDIIATAAKTYDISPKLIKAIIKHESNFNPKAISRAGASGYMQLMADTARSLGVKDIFDPVENIMGGTKYLRKMLDKYNNNLPLALAAYNAGPGNVDKYGGIPPFKETQNYVRKVLHTYFEESVI